MEKNADNASGMKKRSRPLIAGLIALVVVAVAIVAILIISSRSNSYVAKIGNENISKWEYSLYLNQVKESMLNTAKSKDPNLDEKTFWSTKYEGENALDYAKKQALDIIKDSKVQLIKAKEAKTTLTKEQESYIKDYETKVAQQSGSTKQDVIDNVQKTYGVTIGQFKTFLREKYLISIFRQNEINKINNPPDVKTYYAQNPDAFKDTEFRPNGEEAVWVRHILIMTVDPNTMQSLPKDKLDAALKKAQEVLAKAKSGEDFASLAKQYSEDQGSAKYGGDYIFAKGSGMDSNFENAAFSLTTPGQITQELVKISYGYDIIQLVEKIPAGKPVSLNCATQYREFGESAVKQGMYLDKVKKWKDEYKIDINQSVYNSIK